MLEARLCDHLSILQLVDLLESRLAREGIKGPKKLDSIRKVLPPLHQIELKAVAVSVA